MSYVTGYEPVKRTAKFHVWKVRIHEGRKARLVGRVIAPANVPAFFLNTRPVTRVEREAIEFFASTVTRA
jgi:hypothetical protein